MIAYWALCLDDPRMNPREVHTCATSYCISILNEALIRCDKADEKRIHYMKLIGYAVRCLIRLRNKNGTWQSYVQPDALCKDKRVIEEYGEIAIGGTYYSIRALLDVGFLKKDFAYTDVLPENLQTLDGRIEYILQTVRWLLDNRVSKMEFGWYYTNAKSGIPVTDSTMKVYSIFTCILSSIKGNVRYVSWCNELIYALKETESLLVTNIKEDGGLDREIFSEKSTSGIVYTCKLVDALLLSNNSEYVDEVVRAVDFIIKNSEMIWESKTMNQNVFTERYYITTQNGDESVCHEHFVEAIVLHTLLSVFAKLQENGSFLSGIRLNKEKLIVTMKNCAKEVLKLQAKGGENNGLFRSRMGLSEGWYPVYASFEGYRTMRMYLAAEEKMCMVVEKQRCADEGELDKLRHKIITSVPFVPDKPFLFVSYSHRDADVVLKDVLRIKQTYNCWVDFEHIDGGRSGDEKNWMEKVLPILCSPLCKGVILYVSERGFSSNGLLREAEWVLKHKPHFYTFLVDFSDTITPREMAENIEQIMDKDLQRKLRRKSVFGEIVQASADETEYTYYHRKDDFSHLHTYDFQNWLKLIFKDRQE